MKKSKKMRKVKKAKGWSFHVGIPNGIHPSEILKDLTRKNPVAFVTIKDNDVIEFPEELNIIREILGMEKGEKFSENHAVAIHYPLLNKAMACGMKPPVDRVVYEENSTGVYFECERDDFHRVIKWAKKVKYSEVPEEVRKDITVSVSLPKI